MTGNTYTLIRKGPTVQPVRPKRTVWVAALPPVASFRSKLRPAGAWHIMHERHFDRLTYTTACGRTLAHSTAELLSNVRIGQDPYGVTVLAPVPHDARICKTCLRSSQ